MGDKNDGARRGIHLLGNARDPIVEYRLRPLRLFDAPRRAELCFPAALPVVGAGIRVAGYDENIDVRDFHDGADVRKLKPSVKGKRDKGGEIS